ncbi:MAG: hypothetical protein IJX27_01925 [Clostridia bacterium]|nr:hypothetical protein [Clostridia bacterium]
MLFTGKEDFYAQAAACEKLTREREKEYARLMREGDADAREKIIKSYLPTVAAFIKRLGPEMQKLELIYRLLAALEKNVDGFDFLQESEPFSHRLAFALRQAVTRYIAER